MKLLHLFEVERIRIIGCQHFNMRASDVCTLGDCMVGIMVAYMIVLTEHKVVNRAGQAYPVEVLLSFFGRL